jgi:opacity protein-like surface antigen
MVHANFLKRFSAVSVALALSGLGALEARGQDLARVNQDELASFYGRMNVVVGSGARAFGMGGAFLARADDATAASWNPAGLSYLRRIEFSVVGVHNDFYQQIPNANQVVTPPVQVTTLDRLQGSVADFIGFAYPLRFRERTGAVQASYQRSFSFTGSRRAEGPVAVNGFVNSRGERTLPTEFTVEGKGGFDTLSLSSGFEVHPGIRLGLSVNRWVKGFSQTVNRPDARTGGSRQIHSAWDISGTNFNLGALFTPTPKLNLGAVLKTPFRAKVDLSKTRIDDSRIPDEEGRIPPPLVNSEAGHVQIRFPLVYGLGASYRATNTVTVSADFTRTRWSKATITDFFGLGRSGLLPSDVDRYSELPFPAVEAGVDGQADTNQLRVGAEWVLRLGPSGNILLPVRAGFFRDGQPVIIRLTDADGAPLPDVQPSFSGFTAGLGVTLGGVLFDVAYIREAGDVPGPTFDGVIPDPTRRIRYNRVFASVMVRIGQRR